MPSPRGSVTMRADVRSETGARELDRAPVVSAAGDSDAGAWDAFVASRPDASAYHEWAWRGVIERVFGHRSHYLIARFDHRVAGVLPLIEIRSWLFGRSLTSLPFFNYGGVLAESPTVARALFDAAVARATTSGCVHVELRHTARQFPDAPCRQHKVTMRLHLTPDLWDRIDRKARNQVRKAEKSGLAVTRGGAELLDPFYRVFSRNMRDLGTPVYTPRFFSAMLTAFPARARIVIVALKGVPVAAGFTLRTGQVVEIPWASSVRDYNALCPNHLLYWRALEAAVAEGASVFDFGRSTPGEGTFKFKEQWRAEPVPLHWEYWLAARRALPDQSPRNPRFRAFIAAWKRLPLPVANRVGPPLVRLIP